MSNPPGTQVGVGSQLLGNLRIPDNGKSWNYFKEGEAALWHLWGMENPTDDFLKTALAGGTTVATINDQLRAQPHIFSRTGVLKNILIPLSLATTNDNRIRFAIYKSDPNSIYPTERVWSSASILFNTTASGGATVTGYRLTPNLRIDTPGIYYLAWTCNAAFATNNGLCYVTQSSANCVFPYLGVPDRGWSDGFNNPGASTLAIFVRAGWQWSVQTHPYAEPPAIFPGTKTTTPIADGSTVGLSYAGAQQLKGGGAPITVMYRFQND